MRKIMSAKFAGNLLVILNLLLMIFHLLIMFKIISYDFIWGGRISDEKSLFVLESIAIGITLLFILIVLLKIEVIKIRKYKNIVNIAVWIMFVYFTLNILGNIASNATIEKLIFIPISILFSILTLRLAIEK